MDICTKVTLYEQLGAHEHYSVDLEGEMDPAFRGYHRRGSALVRADNPTGLSIMSSVLGLELRLVEGWLRAIDPRSGRMLPTVAEEREDLLAELLTARALVAEAQARATREEEARRREGEARRAAEIRAAAAEARAVGAGAEVVRLREALNRLKPDGTAAPPDTPNAR